MIASEARQIVVTFFHFEFRFVARIGHGFVDVARHGPVGEVELELWVWLLKVGWSIVSDTVLRNLKIIAIVRWCSSFQTLTC